MIKFAFWLQRLFCSHQWEHAEFYMGWVCPPETKAYEALKERRECQKCGKRDVRQLRQVKK